VRIPTNPDTDFDAKQTPIPKESSQSIRRKTDRSRSRSDAGSLIISELDAFGQSGTGL
jgi:hypothetical protein